MGTEIDWHDYVEPEFDGPEVHNVYRCPKCGHREIVPDPGNTMPGGSSVLCPKCKSKMYEDAES